jgi:hypothetical protein
LRLARKPSRSRLRRTSSMRARGRSSSSGSWRARSPAVEIGGFVRTHRQLDPGPTRHGITTGAPPVRRGRAG